MSISDLTLTGATTQSAHRPRDSPQTLKTRSKTGLGREIIMRLLQTTALSNSVTCPDSTSPLWSAEFPLKMSLYAAWVSSATTTSETSQQWPSLRSQLARRTLCRLSTSEPSTLRATILRSTCVRKMANCYLSSRLKTTPPRQMWSSTPPASHCERTPLFFSPLMRIAMGSSRL